MRGKRHSDFFYPQTWNLWRALVLVYMERDGKYLMMRRPIDHHYDACWTGVGGRKGRFEFAVDGMIRRVQYVTGVTPTKWRFRGVLELHYETPDIADRYHDRVYLFTVTDWDGEVTMDSPVGKLKWVDKKQLRRHKLWRGDRVFLKTMERDDMRFFLLMLDYEQDGTLVDALLNLKRTPKEPWDV